MSIRIRSLGVLLAGTAACLSPQAAQAMQAPRQSYDLPAQDLGDALRRVALLADIELYVSAPSIAGKTARRSRTNARNRSSATRSSAKSCAQKAVNRASWSTIPNR